MSQLVRPDVPGMVVSCRIVVAVMEYLSFRVFWGDVQSELYDQSPRDLRSESLESLALLYEELESCFKK